MRQTCQSHIRNSLQIYDSNGRYQTEDDAKTIDLDIKNILELSETEYLERHPNSVMALALELVGEK